jgi:hypothetical protein
MECLKGNRLQAEVNEVIKNGATSSAWIISFNTKLGDSIIFDFMPLQFLTNSFSMVHVLSPLSHLLNPDKIKRHHLDMKGSEWLEGATKEAFCYIKRQVLEVLNQEIKSGDFVFIDSGSLGVWFHNLFSDAGKTLTSFELQMAHQFMNEFLVELTSLMIKQRVCSLLWRDPTADVTWGRNNFSFAFPQVDKQLTYNTFVEDSDKDLLSFIGQNVNVYHISKTIYQYLFGVSFSGEYSAEHFTTKNCAADPALNNYILLNLNTGSLSKRKAVSDVWESLLHEFLSQEIFQHQMSLIITEPEKEWGATLVSRFKELVQEAQKTAKIIIHPLSQRSQLPGLMKNSSAVITHCSGFSHMSHIFNKNVVTFTMDDSISFINGKNPWAPAKSMIIRKANLADDVNQLVNSSL